MTLCSICAGNVRLGWYNRYRFVHGKKYCTECIMVTIPLLGKLVYEYEEPYLFEQV